MSAVSRVAVIGAASQKGQDYLACLLERQDAKVVAIVINQNLPAKVAEWAEKHQWKVLRGGNLEALIATVEFDTAIVALPHNEHGAVAKALLQAGKYVIKEKPLGMTLKEAQSFEAPIFTTVQRATHPLFEQGKADLGLIGKLQSFSYCYAFNLPTQTSGWRADPVKSGGGVVLDMGYHALEVVIRFFGYPQKVDALFGYKFAEMKEKRLEDRALINLQYDGISGTVELDRHADKKEECLQILGEGGRIILTPTSYELFVGQERVKKVDLAASKNELIQKMFERCLGQKNDRAMLQREFQANLQTMRLIDAIYSVRR